MQRLKHIWDQYRRLGVPDQNSDDKRRVEIVNVMSLVLGLMLLASGAIISSRFPLINLSGLAVSLIICTIIPILNSAHKHTTAAVLFSINIPLLVSISQITHKIITPLNELVPSGYYRSDLWLIVAVAFPFISVDPKRRTLLVSLVLFPITLIFGLHFIYELFGKDYASAGHDLNALLRHNVISLIVSVILISIFFFLEMITHSIRMELERKKDELEKLSIVAQETTNAVAIFDSKGNFEWVNQGFVKIYEQTLDDLKTSQGSYLFKTIPNSFSLENGQKSEVSEEVRSIQSAVNDSINFKKPVHYEYATVTKSGRQVIVQTTLTPILDGDGNIKKLITIDSDISKLKETESEIRKQKEEIQAQAVQLKAFNEHLEKLVMQRTQKIQEQNKKLQKYAFSNSHLVRAPLARLLGTIEVLDIGASLSIAQRRELRSNIKYSAQELDKIVKEIGEILEIETTEEDQM